jgi:predicted porin
MDRLKKLILIPAIIITMHSNTALSHMKLGEWGELEFEIGVSSQNVSKGIDENSDRISYSAGVGLEIPAKFIDLYFAYERATVTGNNYSYEDERTFGVRKTINDFTLDAAITETLKKGDSSSNNNNDVNFIYQIIYQPQKTPYKIGLVYSVNDTGGKKAEQDSNVTLGKNYKEINASYDFKDITLSASYGKESNDRDIRTISLSKEFMDIEFTASYINATKENVHSELNKDREYLVFSANKHF